MVFLISMAIAIIFVLCLGNSLRKHPLPYYIISVLIALGVVFCTYKGIRFPSFINLWIYPVFARAALAGSLFIIVMITGALPNGSNLVKKLMPIRGELSIIASILTLGHNIAYGKTYFLMLFKNPERLPTNQLIAAICSLIMIAIMLPLFITSFKCVRKKMNPKSWKSLQRFAYGFYGLLYCHIMLLTVPYAVSGRSFYRLTVFVYSAIFISYLICRIMKAHAVKVKKTDTLKKNQTVGIVIGVFAAAVILFAVASAGNTPAEQPDADDSTEEAAETQDTSEDADAPDDAGAEEPDSEPEDEQETEETPEAPAEADAPEDTTAPDESEASEEEPSEEVPAVTEPEEPVAVTEPSTAPETTSVPDTPKTSETTAPSVPEPAPEPEPIPEPEPEPEVVRTYKDGTFSGNGEGMNGTITVNVTIKDDVITSITIVSANDDDPYFTDGKSVIDDIIAANSANVDTVSGATWSSGGIIDAVAAALKSAKN